MRQPAGKIQRAGPGDWGDQGSTGAIAKSPHCSADGLAPAVSKNGVAEDAQGARPYDVGSR